MSDKWNMNVYLRHSNLHFLSSGILKVNDPLFVTKWLVSKEGFHSRTAYTHLEDESFQVPINNDVIPDTWNQFGLIQNVKSDGLLNAPYHRNKHIEFHYVKEGSFKLKINHHIVTLNKNDVCIINPHCYHSDIIQDKALELYIIGINEDYLLEKKSPFKDLKFVKNSFSKSNKRSEYLLLRNVEKIDTLIDTLDKEIKTSKTRDNLMSLLDNLPTHRCEYIIEEETSRNTMVFEEMSHFIERNYASVTLEDLEFYFNFSKDHISRIIKDESGLSFSKFTQKIRIEKAKEFLIETDLTIKEIMRKVGYKNETYFYKLFKDEMSLSPREYRLKYSKTNDN